MIRTYQDITSRLGKPMWWDENGVPRYDPFSPCLMGVYDRAVAYQRIRCQACHRKFMVAISDNPLFANMGRPLPTKETLGAWHYGDPPPHGCVGDTMNSEQLAVVEFWDRDYEWERHPQCEFEVDPDD